jgi:VWFA-related protein
MESPRFRGVRLGKATWLALLMCSFLSPAGPLRSQQQPPIGVEVKVVNVLATVRDKRGQIVSNLGKDDFELEEDGHPQTIAYFTRETDLPLTLGLLVDTSLSQSRVLDEERSASHSFLDNMLREDKDKAFVIHFDREVELLQDLTSSRQKLESALDLLGAPQLVRGGNGGGDGGSRQRYGGGGTLLYDAVYLASDEVIKKQQGRKALIALSDGVDRGSKETLVDAITAAQRADTVVYSILFADEQRYQSSYGGYGGPGMGRHGGGGHRYPQEERPDGKKILERISRETGGRLFEASKKQPIDQIYTSIAEELRNQYSIGYTPGPGVAPGYHKIHLTAKQKDLTVQTRDGYYSDRWGSVAGWKRGGLSTARCRCRVWRHSAQVQSVRKLNIEKAIFGANLGANPKNGFRIVCIPIGRGQRLRRMIGRVPQEFV